MSDDEELKEDEDQDENENEKQGEMDDEEKYPSYGRTLFDLYTRLVILKELGISYKDRELYIQDVCTIHRGGARLTSRLAPTMQASCHPLRKPTLCAGLIFMKSRSGTLTLLNGTGLWGRRRRHGIRREQRSFVSSRLALELPE